MTGESRAPLHEAPEHDWSAAAARLLPLLRGPGTAGTRLADLSPERLASEGLRSHALPVLDDGPAGLSVAYAIRAGGFDALVNADHLLEWHIDPETLRATALRNLDAWSGETGWTDETEGGRRILSSDSGDGADSARILLPAVRRWLETELRTGRAPNAGIGVNATAGPNAEAQAGADAAATGRVLIGLPDRHLLLATFVGPDDGAFIARFADFVAAMAGAADEPIDGRVFELTAGDLRPLDVEPTA